MVCAELVVAVLWTLHTSEHVSCFKGRFNERSRSADTRRRAPHAKVSDHNPQPACQRIQELFLSFHRRCFFSLPGLEATWRLVLSPLPVLYIRLHSPGSQSAGCHSGCDLFLHVLISQPGVRTNERPVGHIRMSGQAGVLLTSLQDTGSFCQQEDATFDDVSDWIGRNIRR